MISSSDVYNVISATIPLYFAMLLAYISVKYLRLFTSEQCSGINKFVAKFSVPLLSFQIISTNNPYKMNLKLVLSDFLQKVFAFIALFVAMKISSKVRLSWVITGLSLSTLSNTLILGIPLLKAMYGADSAALLAQIVVLQSLIWYNLLLFLFELNSAKVAPNSGTLPQTTGEPEASEEEEEMDHGEDAISRPTMKSKLLTILKVVGKKLIINPNTHATLVGLIWACISFRWHVKLPTVVSKSILILGDGGLGMAMFSLGLFMASQASIVASGTRGTILALGLKFAAGPALMAVSSIAIGLRGRFLRTAIVQAALPQGIVPFVFAKEYNVHPEILSTGVIIGMLVALPITLLYYFLLGL